MAQPNLDTKRTDIIYLNNKNKSEYESYLLGIIKEKCKTCGVYPSSSVLFLIMQSWKQSASKSIFRGDIRNSAIKNFFTAVELKNSGKTPTFGNIVFTASNLGYNLCDDLFNFMTLLFDTYSFNINDIVYVINLVITWTNRFPNEKLQVKTDIVWNFLHRSFFRDAKPLGLSNHDLNMGIRHMRSIVYLKTDKNSSSVRHALMDSNPFCTETLHTLFQCDFDNEICNKFLRDKNGRFVSKFKFSQNDFGYYLLFNLPIVSLQLALNSSNKLESINILYRSIFDLIKRLFIKADIIVRSPTKSKKVKLISGTQVTFIRKNTSYSGEIIKQHKKHPGYFKILATNGKEYKKIPLADIQLQNDSSLEPIKNKSKEWKTIFQKFRKDCRKLFTSHFHLSNQNIIPNNFESINSSNNPGFIDLNPFKNFGKLRHFSDFEKNLGEITKGLTNTIEHILIECLINLNNFLVDLRIDINQSYEYDHILRIYKTSDEELIKEFSSHLDYALNIYNLIKSKQSDNIDNQLCGETKRQSMCNLHDPFNSAYKNIIIEYCNYIEKLSKFRIQHRFSIDYEIRELDESIKRNNPYTYTPLQILLLNSLKNNNIFCIVMSGPTGCGKTTAFSTLDNNNILFYFAPSGSVVEQFTAKHDNKKN